MDLESGRPRTIGRIVAAVETTEGDGMRIRRAFPTYALADLDPFLLFDHLGPIHFQPGEAKGFPDHPHRGFETVTYLLWPKWKGCLPKRAKGLSWSARCVTFNS